MRDLFDKPICSADVGRLDRNSNTLGISNIQLMESAGLQAANIIIQELNFIREKGHYAVYIFCGKGNNGGDGFVIARHLASRGISVNVVLVGKPAEIRTEVAQLNWSILKNLPLYIQTTQIIDSTKISPYFTTIQENTKSVPIFIDALLGTGISGTIREPFATLIKYINDFSYNHNIPVISIDVPSGINPNEKEKPDIFIQSSLLITFHRNKVGFIDNPHIKKVITTPIGIPYESHLFVGRGDLTAALKKRKMNTHKGEHGKVLVIGGSEMYSGAPALASLACLELGVDLVNTYVPKLISNVVREYSPHLIVRDGCANNICPNDFDQIKKLIPWADSILIGPGLGRSLETSKFCELFFKHILSEEIHVPLIIDADGIYHFNKFIRNNPNVVNFEKENQIILTPHSGELQNFISENILCEIPKFDETVNRITFLLKHLKKYPYVFLVKGVYDFIIDMPNNKYKVNRTGVPEMSVGGTGDVLAGIVAGLSAVGNENLESASVGAYINGLAGESIIKGGKPSLAASDLIKSISNIIF